MRNHSLAFVLYLSTAAVAQEAYKKPAQEILDVLHAPQTPLVTLSPSRDMLIQRESMSYPPIAEVARPMLRLAGLRIDPINNGPHLAANVTGLVLQNIADGSEIRVHVPRGARISHLAWSPDGKQYSFLNAGPTQMELWVGDRSGRARQLPVRVNAVSAEPVYWMADSRTLLVQTVPAHRAAPPAAPPVPKGPDVQESAGKRAGTGTFEDLLQNPHDEDLYEHYATAQLALIDTAIGQVRFAGKPAIFHIAAPSPDGKYLLVARIHRPFSYLYTAAAFPKEVEVWDTAGRLVHKVASQPLYDSVPLDGVAPGPRHYSWKSVGPATLVWAESLDGGDPHKKVPFRDRIVTLPAPFTGEPVEVTKLEHRFSSIEWMENGMGVVVESNRARRWVRTFLLDGTQSRELFSRSTGDRYKNPGTFVKEERRGAILVSGDAAYLIGEGSSPEGDRPFLDRLNLKTLQTEHLFRSPSDSYELPVAVLDTAGPSFLTRRESPVSPPNYFVHEADTARALTHFADPAPRLRGITAQLVTYRRADGVQCSFTLYLPPGYKEGTRLPTVLWAYPREYNDPETAGQVAGSSQRFTTIRGYSHLFFLLRGYAVLDGATMPVVGESRTANNTYIDQIVMSAKAAIEKAVAMGVTDPDRVGVGGHSYGAFMTANLLAHSDLFRAGIARSGAYNRTLTPFGFQSERRTLWEASEIYLKMSPFLYANKIKEPILLVHGEADNNMGTFPIQSERMYQAIRGNGGTVRLVMLPGESHGYAARESVEHVLYEMLSWFDRYVKDAGPRTLPK